MTTFRLAILAALSLTAALAQHDHAEPPPLPQRLTEPMQLYPKILGTFTRPISSKNSEAQAYFNQAFQLMYAFDQDGAIRSFREAEKRDPNCAICFWGEAWSWGSYLNGPMTADKSPHAYAAIQQAMKLAPANATPVERAFIEAMSVRYVPNFEATKKKEQDLAYAEAARKLHEQFPKDVDAGTLYGEALFVMEPRRGSRDIDAPNVRKIFEIFERVLAIDPQHVGACHLYVHIAEATVQPAKAEACADTLGHAVPGASHLNHMPSHIWNQTGRWGDSVRANIEAVHHDQKAAIGEGFAIYPPHNLHMLIFAASMDGQSAIAIQAARDYGKLTSSTMYRVLTLVRFGRFDEILEITEKPKEPIEAGIWHFGQGYARLRAGEKDAARTHLKDLVTASTSSAVFRTHPARNLLGALVGILEGELHRADADLDKAIVSFEQGVARGDAMIYDEPEALPFAARHWLGAALLEAKRYPDAERVYREDLKRHPKNGWSLFGLKKSLEAQSKPTQEIDRDLTASWSRSDFWLRSSRL